MPRTRKRIKGGNPTEIKFREYASKIANKEPVSIESFSAFLESVKDPLKVVMFQRDNRREKHISLKINDFN
jgi:hypothetical protein